MCNRVTKRCLSDVRVSQEAVTLAVCQPCLCRGRGRKLALQYLERSGLKVSERLGMVMEMESGDSRIRTEKI